jgi:uncharacterized tellurite resistance protein B-like protein
MFNKVSDFFKGKTNLLVDASGNPTDEDLLISTGVILLEMAGSDDDFAPEELQTIFKVMQEEFQIDKGEVYSLLNQADLVRSEKGKIDEFVAAINANFKAPQRQRILSMVWQVVNADGHVEKFEQRFATQLKYRLKLTDEEAIEAKKMAEGKAKEAKEEK